MLSKGVGLHDASGSRAPAAQRFPVALGARSPAIRLARIDWARAVCGAGTGHRTTEPRGGNDTCDTIMS